MVAVQVLMWWNLYLNTNLASVTQVNSKSFRKDEANLLANFSDDLHMVNLSSGMHCIPLPSRFGPPGHPPTHPQAIIALQFKIHVGHPQMGALPTAGRGGGAKAIGGVPTLGRAVRSKRWSSQMLSYRYSYVYIWYFEEAQLWELDFCFYNVYVPLMWRNIRHQVLFVGQECAVPKLKGLASKSANNLVLVSCLFPLNRVRLHRLRLIEEPSVESQTLSSDSGPLRSQKSICDELTWNSHVGEKTV